MTNIAERQETKDKWHFVVLTKANDGLSQGYACFISCCKAGWRNTGVGTKYVPAN